MNATLVIVNGLKFLYISAIANIIVNITEIQNAAYRCGWQRTHALTFLTDRKYTSEMSI